MMSNETLEFHYGKHHKGYVDKLNKLIAGTEYEEMSLVDIVKRASGPIFNNAAQVWNHTFFWECMAPKGSKLTGDLLSAIERDFGTQDKFVEEFKKQGAEIFGSGWVWLVRNHDGKLSIEKTSNADNPLRMNKQPLLVCDVWEHAYYIDYRNDRAKFLDAFGKIANWEFAARNFEAKYKIESAA